LPESAPSLEVKGHLFTNKLKDLRGNALERLKAARKECLKLEEVKSTKPLAIPQWPDLELAFWKLAASRV
jgi:hypothetical protein